MKSLIALVLLFSTAIGQSVFAAGESAGGRGGEVVFLCGKRVILAESAELVGTKTYKRLKGLNLRKPEQALESAVNFVSAKDSRVGELLSRALGELHPDTYVTELPLLGNDKITKIPPGCTMAQLAVQDFEAATLTVNELLLKDLSKIDRLLFRLHEGYLRVLWLADHDPDIQAVRDQVFTWAKNPGFLEFLQVEANQNNDTFFGVLVLRENHPPVNVNGTVVDVSGCPDATGQSLSMSPENFDCHLRQVLRALPGCEIGAENPRLWDSTVHLSDLCKRRSWFRGGAITADEILRPTFLSLKGDQSHWAIDIAAVLGDLVAKHSCITLIGSEFVDPTVSDLWREVAMQVGSNGMPNLRCHALTL